MNILINMSEAIESFYEKLKASGRVLVTSCEKSGQSWGWKIDSEGVRIVECGCYVEAVWPIVVTSVLGGIGKVIGTSAGKPILKRLSRKYAKKLSSFADTALTTRAGLITDIKQGTSKLLQNNLPPVPPEHVRYWRGESNEAAHAAMRCVAEDLSPTTSGRWFARDRRYSDSYTSEDGFQYYLDIPRDKVRGFDPSYQGPGTRWPYLPDDPNNLGNDVTVLLGPVSRYGEILGEIKKIDGKIYFENLRGSLYEAMNQESWRLGNRANLNSYLHPTIIERRRPDGTLEKVLDLWDDTIDETEDNIHLTRGSPIPRPDDEIDVTINSLPEIIVIKDELIGKARLAVPYHADAILREITCKESAIIEHLAKLFDTSFCEEFITPGNSTLRQNYSNTTSDLMEDWLDTLSRFIDETSDEGKKLIETSKTLNNDIKTTFSSNGFFISDLLNRFSLFIAFAINILSAATIVVDKECSPIMTDDAVRSYSYGPSDKNALSPKYRYNVENAVDSIFFKGKWKGSSVGGNLAGSLVLGVGFRDPEKVCKDISDSLGPDPSWQKIYQVLIDNKLPIWPNINENCECSDCPPEYELCSYGNLGNLYTDVYSICLPVCGGQTLKPITTSGVVTRANCDSGCPEGFIWVECNDSDCPNEPCNDNSEKRGFCAKIPESNIFRTFDGPKGKLTVPQKYGRQFWDSTTCRWICKNFVEVQEIIKDGNIQIVTPNNWEPEYIGLGGTVELKNPFIPNKVIFYSDCPEGSVRVPEEDCDCKEAISSGSYDDIGTPEVPNGYTFFDNSVIPILK